MSDALTDQQVAQFFSLPAEEKPSEMAQAAIDLVNLMQSVKDAAEARAAAEKVERGFSAQLEIVRDKLRSDGLHIRVYRVGEKNVLVFPPNHPSATVRIEVIPTTK